MRLAMCTYHTNRKFGRLSILADEKDNDITLDHIVNKKERRHFPPIPHARMNLKYMKHHSR